MLSGSLGVQKFLDVILARNKGVKKLVYPKALGALCRRKAQEFSLASEQLQVEDRSASGQNSSEEIKQAIPASTFEKTVLLSSVHYDPLFGLSSGVSEVARTVSSLKRRTFLEFADELPIKPENSGPTDFALNQLQSPVNSLELVEKSGVGTVGISYGEFRSAHSSSIEIWNRSLLIPAQRSERVIFGCGGGENDRNLTDAFGRALFPVLMNVALPDNDSKVCMLAECGSGLGSEAFLKFVTGRLDPRSKIGGVDYIDGLEVLVSFQRLQRNFELSILTTLPRFYASKFDLKAIGGAREAPAALVQQGSRAKILVLPDASSASFKA